MYSLFKKTENKWKEAGVGPLKNSLWRYFILPAFQTQNKTSLYERFWCEHKLKQCCVPSRCWYSYSWHSLKRVLLKTNMLNKKMMHFYIGKARPLFHLFSIFLHQRYNCYNKYWDRKNICTIQYRDSNFWRLNREARPLTNRRRCGRPISMHLQLLWLSNELDSCISLMLSFANVKCGYL